MDPNEKVVANRARVKKAMAEVLLRTLMQEQEGRPLQYSYGYVIGAQEVLALVVGDADLVGSVTLELIRERYGPREERPEGRSASARVVRL